MKLSPDHSLQDPTPLDGLQNEIPVIVSFSMVHSMEDGVMLQDLSIPMLMKDFVCKGNYEYSG